MVSVRSQSRPVVLGPVRWTPNRITGLMLTGGGPQPVFIDGVDCPEEAAADAFFAIVAAAALHQQRPTLVVPAIGAETERRLRGRQERFFHLVDGLESQPIHARHRSPLGEPPPGRDVGVMFTAGLDSFHLVLQNRDRIDRLVFVHGFDVPVHDWRQQAVVNHRVRRSAAEIGLPLDEVTSDLRDWSDSRADWSLYVHAGIDAVGLALANRCREVWFAASVVERHLPTNGIDAEHSGNEWVQIIRQDAHLTRPEKVEAIVDHPVFRRHLRVCWANTGEYNCGRCDKCVRTMINLAAVGVLGAVETLPAELPEGAIASLSTATRSDRAFLLDNVEAAERNGQKVLATALERRLEAAIIKSD